MLRIHLERQREGKKSSCKRGRRKKNNTNSVLHFSEMEARTHCFFDIAVGGQPAGRVIFEVNMLYKAAMVAGQNTVPLSSNKSQVLDVYCKRMTL